MCYSLTIFYNPLFLAGIPSMNERLAEEKSLTRITKTSEKFTTIDGIRKTVNIKTNSKNVMNIL